MEKGNYFQERNEIYNNSAVKSLLEQTITEIAGDRRVLIEHHYGVKSYSRDKILIKVKFGTLCVNGKNLEIVRMTSAQLIICGQIDSVSIQRRNL